MNEGAALRVLSFLTDTNERHLASLASEKRKVTVIGEEHEPDEFTEEATTSSVINEEPPGLTPEQLKEFFKAAEEGSIERLDELFDTISNVNPNMTNYTESLLMAAIRAKRRKVAEYLIDQLAVNVSHTTDLIEFRLSTRIPIRERTVSCRDLAYERGMMDLVDLIDISSDEVKPSIKRYLHRRLKNRLDEIHQAYLKRVRERSRRTNIQRQEKENEVLEENELEKENEETSVVNITDDTSPPPPLPPTLPPLGPAMIQRSYKSHIKEAIQKFESKNEKSIDESGKKVFRFSNYTVRYRLLETTKSNLETNDSAASKATLSSLPFVPPPTSTQPISRPTTTATATNRTHYSVSEINTRIPVRETRTSICRSARHRAIPHVGSSVIADNKSDVHSSVTNSVNTTQRLLPQRSQRIRRDYAYIPQLQHTVYNDPRRSVPVTLKTTAIGLPSNTRLIRY